MYHYYIFGTPTVLSLIFVVDCTYVYLVNMTFLKASSKAVFISFQPWLLGDSSKLVHFIVVPGRPSFAWEFFFNYVDIPTHHETWFLLTLTDSSIQDKNCLVQSPAHESKVNLLNVLMNSKKRDQRAVNKIRLVDIECCTYLTILQTWHA